MSTGALVQARRLARGETGGAMIELAVFTFVFVPLALYGVWFSDAIHFGIRAQEASIIPVWDVTAKLLHDEANGSDPLGKLSGAASKAQTDVQNDMQNSFDSADPGGTPVQQSVFGRAGSLTVSVKPVQGSGSAPDSSIAWISGAVHADDARLPLNTWVVASSQLTLTTGGIPTEYDTQRAGGLELFPSKWLSMPICGIGPGIAGCVTNQNAGFYLFTDDWGCEDGSANPLSIGSSNGNDAYWNVATEFYSGAGDPGSVTSMIAGWGDLGQTASFRLTYQRGGSGAYSATEDGHGQTSPHGGAASLHTGGPWHDEGTPQNAGQLTFSARSDNHYMAVSSWPAD